VKSSQRALLLGLAIGAVSVSGCGVDKVAPSALPADMVGTWSSRNIQLVIKPDRTWDCLVIYRNLPQCLTSQGMNSLQIDYGGIASGDLSLYSFVQDTTAGGLDHIVTTCTARYETSGASESVAGTLAITISGGCSWSEKYDFTLTRLAGSYPEK
jgi:hypothetical protein